MRNRLRLRDIELNQVDVLVLGAGPAGCAAAILLARRSHRVMLVSPETPISGSLPVSIPPSPRPIPGVPVEQNLHGISFAVANATGGIARLINETGMAQSADSIIDLIRSRI